MTAAAFNILIIGAGNVNFGNVEDHEARKVRPAISPPRQVCSFKYRKLGDRLNVVGLVDPDVKRARIRLDEKVGAGIHGYKDTKVFPSIKEAGSGLSTSETPQMGLLGIQPTYRGSTAPGKDAELEVKRYFPGIAIFVEKPISSSPLSEVQAVCSQLEGTISSVGYMLRYLDAVTTMRNLITENKLTIMSSIATYFMAYEFGGTDARARGGYFDTRVELGPIVGQATHIVDLCRFLCGEVDLSSVAAAVVERWETPGNLSRSLYEDHIPEEFSIPRITNALWKWENGATGMLVHAVALHDGLYETELTILADGWKLKLVDLYGTPRLQVRRPGSDVQEETVFNNDDPFFSEISCFIDVVEGKSGSQVVRSSYADAIKTYELVSLFQASLGRRLRFGLDLGDSSGWRSLVGKVPEGRSTFGVIAPAFHGRPNLDSGSGWRSLLRHVRAGSYTYVKLGAACYETASVPFTLSNPKTKPTGVMRTSIIQLIVRRPKPLG
ncbi:hypothetical protein P7C73_g374, partial [Tremellales sp. Uapishka_1]